MIKDFVIWMYEDLIGHSLIMLLVCAVNGALLGTILLVGNKSLSSIVDIIRALNFLNWRKK